MIRRSVASSSGVQAANDLCRSASASEAIRPSVASSGSPSPCGGSVARHVEDGLGFRAHLGPQGEHLPNRVARR